MIKNLFLLFVVFFSLIVAAQDEIIVVPVHEHKIVTDMICRYVVATFEVPSCYKFQKVSRLDLVEKYSEGLPIKADVFIAGLFSHSSECSCEESKLVKISVEDSRFLPWEFAIKKQVFYVRPANQE
jgi:hypothetical protein